VSGFTGLSSSNCDSGGPGGEDRCRSGELAGEDLGESNFDPEGGGRRYLGDLSSQNGIVGCVAFFLGVCLGELVCVCVYFARNLRFL
jgi:hypothetical protein